MTLPDTSPAVGHLVVGPNTHGVVRYALDVAEALTNLGEAHSVARMDTPDADVPESMRRCEWIHMHVTDRLFGRSPADATEAIRRISNRLARPMSVTMHDIPQPSDGGSMAARAAFYGSVASVAAGLVVSSRHEAVLLAEHVDARLNPEIVPLAIESHSYERPTAWSEPTVGVLGFVYPGKGHIETARALRDMPQSVAFLALGAPSPGHEYLIDELREEAGRSGRRCETTGFLTDEVLRRRIAGVTVPVAYHRHMSASGSINTWIGSGRKPLVPKTSYTVELDARSPGSVLIHEDDETSLREAIAECLAEPSRTWREVDIEPVPSPADVALQYSTLFRRWAR